MNKVSRIRIFFAVLLSISLISGFQSLVFAQATKSDVVDLGVSNIVITDKEYVVIDGWGVKLEEKVRECSYGYCSRVSVPFTFAPYPVFMGSFTPDKLSRYPWNQTGLYAIITNLLGQDPLYAELKRKKVNINYGAIKESVKMICSFAKNTKFMICTTTFKMDESNLFQRVFSSPKPSKSTYKLTIPVCPIGFDFDPVTHQNNANARSQAVKTCEQNFKKILPQTTKKPLVTKSNLKKSK